MRSSRRTMSFQRLQLPLLILASTYMVAVFTGCTSIKHISCKDDSFYITTTNNIILPKVVARTETTATYDFSQIIVAKPVIKVSGPAKAKIKYRTYSNAADAVESVFELPDLNPHEQATDLMDRIVLITAAHESKSVRKFRFLVVELSDNVDILRTWAVPSSSQASYPHQQARPSRSSREDP